MRRARVRVKARMVRGKVRARVVVSGKVRVRVMLRGYVEGVK